MAKTRYTAYLPAHRIPLSDIMTDLPWAVPEHGKMVLCGVSPDSSLKQQLATEIRLAVPKKYRAINRMRALFGKNLTEYINEVNVTEHVLYVTEGSAAMLPGKPATGHVYRPVWRSFGEYEALEGEMFKVLTGPYTESGHD